MNVIFLTNNPMVQSELTKNNKECLFIESETMLPVFLKTRDFVHKSYRLLTHPLSGSIKPNETPFKTIIIEKSETIELLSLSLIEEAIMTCEKFLKSKPMNAWSEKIMDDFMFIDFCLIKEKI